MDINNNFNINTSSPIKDIEKFDLTLNKNNTHFFLPLSAKGNIGFNKKKIGINENIFKKILKYIKTVISYENFNDYIPKLISIVKKYICFCPDSRNDIFL